MGKFLQTGEQCREPDLAEKCQVALEHIRALHQFYGAQKGFRVARKHLGWYLDNIKPDMTFKRQFNAISDPDEQLVALSAFFDSILVN